MIDSHFHVWDPRARAHEWLASEPQLNRRFWIDDFRALAQANDIEGAVLVQVLNDFDETTEFLALAARHDLIAGVVGWIDLEGDVAGQLAALRAKPGGDRLVGIRHLVQDEADPNYLDRPSVVRGIEAVRRAGVAYDVLVRPPQLPAALRLARRADNQLLVLDHAAKPSIARGDTGGAWSTYVAQLASLEHVMCKLSGLVTEAGPTWAKDQILPYAELLLDWFGPERLVFGSDWPVCSAVARYEDVVNLAKEACASLSPSEQEAVFSANARRVYRLGA